MTFTFYNLSDIKNTDILDNVSKQCKAILLHLDIYWIEITDNGFFVDNGNEGFKTNNFTLAVNCLSKFIIDNN
jgi:hypothetical protein